MDGLLAGGSGVDHASLEPQASMFERLEKAEAGVAEDWLVAGAGVGLGAGCERLKALLACW